MQSLARFVNTDILHKIMENLIVWETNMLPVDIK